jgi:hypothetical protein
MLVEIMDGFQSLHFDTLTLNPTRVNKVVKCANNLTHRPHDVDIIR